MDTVTRDAATQLGVSQRQVQRLARDGRVLSREIAGRRVVSSRSLIAASRSAGRGRSWEGNTVVAACELLLTGATDRMSGSQRTRLRARLRTISISDLAYQVLSDRVTLWRSTRPTSRDRESDGLTSTGQRLDVKVTRDAAAFARRARLLADADGDTLIVELDLDATAVVEDLALYAYGDERTSVLARQRIERLQSEL